MSKHARLAKAARRRVRAWSRLLLSPVFKVNREVMLASDAEPDWLTKPDEIHDALLGMIKAIEAVDGH